MRPLTFLFACLILATGTRAQDLQQLGVIEKSETKIIDVRVEKLDSGNRSFIFLFEEKGGLEVYDTERNLVLKQPPGQACVHWESGYLHHGRLYCLAPEFTAVDFSAPAPVSRRISSVGLDVKNSEHLLGFEVGGKEFLAADNRTGIDLYTLPELTRIAAIARDDPQTGIGRCIEFSGNTVFYTNRDNEVAAYDCSVKRVIWKVNAGSKSPKFLGISLGTKSNLILNLALNRRNGLLYANTIFGDLFKIRISDGSVILRKDQFRGTGNNAGLLTNLAFQDLNGDGKLEIVAPSVDNNVYCLNADDFSVIWAYDAGNEVQRPLAFRDVTGDGTPDVFAVSDYDLKLSIIDGVRGTRLYEKNFEKEDKFNQTSVGIAECSGGPPLRLVVQTGWRMVRMFDLSGFESGLRRK